MNDTREQLERSIDRFLGSWTGWSVSIKVLREATIGWLDRQAAITEAEGFKKALSLLEGRDSHIAELQAKLNYLEGHGVEIVDAVAGGYEVYNEWHRRADELEEAMAMDSRIRAQQSDAVDNLAKQRDELLAQVDELTEQRDRWRDNWRERNDSYSELASENDDYREEVDRLQRRNDELRTSYDKLKSERDNLADDLLTCNREREQLRKNLSIALDHAHDICVLVDIGE